MDGIGFLGIFVALVGAVCLYWGWSSNARSAALKAAAARWPTTAGTITTATVSLQGKGPRSSYYVPSVEYAYSVNGQSFVGDRIRFGFMGNQSRAAAEPMIEAYPVGATGMVHYDPQNPSESVLEPQTVGSNMVITAIGGTVILLMGLGIVTLAAEGSFSDGRRSSRSSSGATEGGASSGSVADASTSNVPELKTTTPQAPAPVADQPRSIGDMDRAWLVGLWSYDTECRTTLELADDGSFVGAEGTRGNWYLGAPGSSALYLRSGGQVGHFHAEWLGQNGLRLTQFSDRRSVSMIRCVR